MTNAASTWGDISEIILGISEGPIAGLEDGAKSLYLGDTPLVDPVSNVNNYSTINLFVRPGNPSGEVIRPRLGGFATTNSVNVELGQSIPVTRSGSKTHIKYLDFRFVINALSYAHEKGIRGYSVYLKMEYKRSDSSTWQVATNFIATLENDFPTDPAYFSLIGTSDPNTGAVPNPNDRTIYFVDNAPATVDASDINRLWIDSNGLNRPYLYVGTSWVAQGTSAVQTADLSYWQFVEGTKTRRVYFAGTVRETFPPAPNLGDIFVTTKFGTTTACFWNGSVWVPNRLTIRPLAISNPYGPGNGIYTDYTLIADFIQGATPCEYRVPVDDIDVPYDLRVTCYDPSGANPEVSSSVTWESFQEISPASMSFPNLATAQILVKASEQLSGLPEISGIYKGRIVKVPSNYNAVTRVYTGIWDGTYQLAYTDNPFWIILDLVENNRYGANAYFPIVLDKMSVYKAAQWSDVMVPTGVSGGTQPRFTFNGLISEKGSTRERIDYMCGAYGARYFDDGNGYASIAIDTDSPPVALFTKENIVGDFIYSQTDISQRANDVTVTFTNPNLSWNQDTRRVVSNDHIGYYGRVRDDFVAVGCIDVHEAIRRARYRLLTATTETETVVFKTNRQGLNLKMYSTILIADPEDNSGITGRIDRVVGSNRIELRDKVYLDTGIGYKITFTIPDRVNGGTKLSSHVLSSSVTGSTSYLLTDTELPSLPEYAPFCIETISGTAVPKSFRVVSCTPSSTNKEEVEISAMQINRTKWDTVESSPSGDDISLAKILNLRKITPPSNLQVTTI